MFKTNPSFLQILPNKKALYFVLLTLLIGLSGIAFSAYLKVSGQTAEAQGDKPQETTAQQCPTCRPPTPQVIYAPLIDLPGASSSEIVLNCRSSHIIDAVPTFYTDTGESIIGQTISLKPAEMRFVDVMSLIPAEHRNRHKWGGMSLSYTGNSMEVWAQLTLHGIGEKGSTDVLFVVVNAPRSNVREAVWRMPKNAAATIALGNYSDSLTVATLTYSNGEVEQVNVAPYATEIVKRRNNGQNQSNVEAESVRIESSGELGRLIPTGLVVSNNGGFASSIRFYDPQNFAQPNLYATNFRLKDSTPHLVLKNTSDNTVTAQPRFLPASGEGSGVVELPAVTIAANAIKEVNLTALVNEAKTRADLDSVSVQIINSGAAGSLVGAVNTTNNLTKVDYDIPLRDSGLPRNSAGGYTVRLDDDYSTILSITNAGDKSGKFTMQVNFDGGFYAMYPQRLEPGATATFDIRNIRDEQIPDSEGRKLPLDFAFGQIRWSIVGAPQTRLIGRSEVISRSRNVSSSYSCFVCCPNMYNSGWITPYLAEIDEGETFQFSSQQQDRDCYQNLYSPYLVEAAWTINDEQIATVGSDGSTTAISEGDAYLTANWTGQLWWGDATEACLPDEVAVNRNANVIVKPTLIINVPQNAMDGDTVEFSVTVRNGTPTAYQWSFEPTSGGNNPQVNFTAPTAVTTQAKAHWFAKPDIPCPDLNSRYTIKVKVTFQGGGSKTKEAPFTVKVDRLWGGKVIPPSTLAPEGTLDIAFNSKRGLWIVVGPGRLKRVPSPIDLRNTPTTTQFYDKIYKHEEVHFEQYTKQGGIFYDLYQIDNVMPRLLQLTDPNPQVLEQKIYHAVEAWRGEQDLILDERLPRAEDEAHAVADPIAPKYLFQKECQR